VLADRNVKKNQLIFRLTTNPVEILKDNAQAGDRALVVTMN